MVVPRIIIPRKELKDIGKLRKAIIYGRRKVGKTFTVVNFLKPTHYFFVFSKEIINLYGKKITQLDYNSFKSLFLEVVKNGKNFVVIDEFQRLGKNFLNFLHMINNEINSKLLLLSSSNFFVKKILSEKSPILGLFQIYRLGLFTTTDILKYLTNKLPKKDLLTGIIFLRDPWLIQFYEKNIEESILFSIKNVPGLVGEIFKEEGREITSNYENVLRAISLGNYRIKDIASFLRKKSQDVKPFVRNLVEMGILYKVKIFNKKEFLYLIESPIVDLYYFLDTKYGIEIELSKSTFKKALEEKIPFYFENFVRRYYAEKINGNEEKMEVPEVDGIITIRGRAKIALEVKVGEISKSDVKKFEEKVKNLKCKKIVVNLDKLLKEKYE